MVVILGGVLAAALAVEAVATSVAAGVVVTSAGVAILGVVLGVVSNKQSQQKTLYGQCPYNVFC